MRWVAASLFLVLSLLLAGACGGSTLSGSSVKTCHASSDCATGESCQFSVYESCGAAGVCVPSLDGSACIPQTACGCNGATETVCLVNGNSPSPISSLGSCDGATQQGVDANLPDATVSSAADADDPDSPVTSEDSGPVQREDANPGVDAADAAPTSLLGVSCTAKSQCAADPVYTECETVSGSKICTTFCVSATDCQPPANGTCDQSDNYCELQ